MDEGVRQVVVGRGKGGAAPGRDERRRTKAAIEGNPNQLCRQKRKICPDYKGGKRTEELKRQGRG